MAALHAWSGGPARAATKSAARTVIIGAGAAGLAAAAAMQAAGQQVVVLEARQRIGGRVWSDTSFGLPVELGAGEIHGEQGNPLTGLAARLDIGTVPTRRDLFQFFAANGASLPGRQAVAALERFQKLLTDATAFARNSAHDMSLAQAMDVVHPNFAELGPEGFWIGLHQFYGPLDQLSARHWAVPKKFQGTDLMLPQGFARIFELLAQKLDVRLGQVVQAIDSSTPEVRIHTEHEIFHAERVIVTLPHGVLAQRSIRFTPELPDWKHQAIDALGHGQADKIAMEFEVPFWDMKQQFFGVRRPGWGLAEMFLNVGRHSGRPVLVGFVLGRKARQDALASANGVGEGIMSSLRQALGSQAPPPRKVVLTDWSGDPFSRAPFAMPRVGSTPQHYAALAQPLNERVHFAGEHTLFDYRASVHGAWMSGERAAQQVLRTLA